MVELTAELKEEYDTKDFEWVWEDIEINHEEGAWSYLERYR